MNVWSLSNKKGRDRPEDGHQGTIPVVPSKELELMGLKLKEFARVPFLALDPSIELRPAGFQHEQVLEEYDRVQ